MQSKVIVMTQNIRSNRINGSDLVISIGETNQDDSGKFGALAVMDQLVLQYMKRHYVRLKGNASF